MSDLLNRIADYFKNDYQGDDKTAPTMEITVNDLRYIANMNVDRCRAEAELRNLKYNKCKDFFGCVQCKTDENAIKEYIDKVVDELEKLKDKGSVTKTEKLITKSCIDKAIKIVKQGGVYDDVCEWKVFDNSLTNEPQWAYETTCGKYVGEEHTSKAFVYCPYCSKKIKVVD